MQLETQGRLLAVLITAGVIGSAAFFMHARQLVARSGDAKLATPASPSDGDRRKPRRAGDVRVSVRTAWSVSGIVQSGGVRALPGAQVCSVGSSPRVEVLQPCAVTDAEGLFSLSAAEAVAVALIASAPGHLSRTYPLSAGARAENERALVLSLEPGGVTVTGTAVDMTGGVVSGAMIVARQETDQPAAVTLSDSAGHFRCEVPAGKLLLSAEADGYSVARAEVLAPASNVELALVPASTLRGHVVAALDQTPIAGATVTLSNTNGLRASELSALSSSDGSFQIDEVPAGRYEIIAISSQWRSRPRGLAVGVGELSDDLWLSAFPATTLHATIEVGGEPCASGFVELDGPLTTTLTAGAAAAIEAAGLLVGKYRANVGCRELSHEPTEEIVELGREPVTRAWNLTPKAAESAAPDCCAPAGVIRVSVKGTNQPLPAPRLGWGRSRATGVSISGAQQGTTFVFEKLELGEYTAYLSQAPQIQQSVVLERDGQVIDIQLDAPARMTISGRVVADDGTPVADAWVRAFGASAARGSERAPVLTDLEGAFVIEDVSSESYTLAAESALSSGRVKGIRGGARGVVVPMVAYGSLSGSVANAAGVAEQFSLAYRRQGDAGVRQLAGAGSWSLRWVPAGTYDLVAITASGLATAQVSVAPGDNVDVPLIAADGAGRPLPAWVQELPRWGDLARADSN